MAGLELILGVAIGYIAFTENGHEIGNKIADIAVKQAKKTVESGYRFIKGGDNSKEDETNGGEK